MTYEKGSENKIQKKGDGCTLRKCMQRASRTAFVCGRVAHDEPTVRPAVANPSCGGAVRAVGVHVRRRDLLLLIALELRCRGFGRLGGAEPRTLVSGSIHPGILVDCGRVRWDSC